MPQHALAANSGLLQQLPMTAGPQVRMHGHAVVSQTMSSLSLSLSFHALRSNVNCTHPGE